MRSPPLTHHHHLHGMIYRRVLRIEVLKSREYPYILPVKLFLLYNVSVLCRECCVSAMTNGSNKYDVLGSNYGGIPEFLITHF